jgi:hypothetical protein
MVRKFTMKDIPLSEYNFPFVHLDLFLITSSIYYSCIIKLRSLYSALAASTLSYLLFKSQSHESKNYPATGYFLTPKYLFFLTSESKETHFVMKPKRPVIKKQNMVTLKATSWSLLNPEYYIKQGMDSHLMLIE